MAKNKQKEAVYKAEGRRRLDIRIRARKEKRGEKIRERDRLNSHICRGCGEEPYCYCGDGTPYSY